MNLWLDTLLEQQTELRPTRPGDPAAS
jgi:hypothetical protein